MTKNPILSAVTIGLALCLAGGAQAQTQLPGKVKFPAGLKWRPMSVVSFDYQPKQFGNPNERELALSVWGDTIKAMPVNEFKGDGSKMPSFVLISAYDDARTRYLFTSLDAASTAYAACEDPPNSAAPETPIYSMCPMRVVLIDRATGKRSHQDFLNYCHLSGVDDKDTPASKNHMDIAVAGNTAYFRVIQYGKHVPECDRAIRLQ